MTTPRPVSLAYPAAITIPVHAYSLGPYIGETEDTLGFVIYGDLAHAYENTLEVAFINIRRLILENPAPVMCPACLVHRRAIVMMTNFRVYSQCPECGGMLDDLRHGEGASVNCVCGQIPHAVYCPMFPRRP